MMRSWASAKRSVESAGGTGLLKYSQPMPRTKPEMMRPPEMTSSMAISSATRSGLPCSGMALPITPIGMCFVRCTSIAAMMLGEGMVP